MLLSTDATVPAALLPSLSRYHSLQVTCAARHLYLYCTAKHFHVLGHVLLNECFDSKLVPRCARATDAIANHSQC